MTERREQKLELVAMTLKA